MKKNVMLRVAFFMTVGLVGCNHSDPSNELIVVNASAGYPEKKLILQDFMDVEYIPLETSDGFITQGELLAVGSKYLFVKNWINDGDIFVFDRNTGKSLRRINRKGQGPEEYTLINGAVWDDDRNELFINCTQIKAIQVYDSSGNFKRSLKHIGDAQYLNVYNFDKDNLICYDASVHQKNGQLKECPSFHTIISKKDGSVTQQISIPFEIVQAPMLIQDGGAVSIPVLPIVPYGNDWLLVETSTDTIYHYSTKNKNLSPFLVKNQTEDPDFVLTMGIITDRYYFVEAIKKVFDFNTGRGFPTTSLMYDRNEGALCKPIVFNGDYVNEKKVNMSSSSLHKDVANFQILTANRLIEALGNNELQGSLKEIAMQLNDESNPVIMLIKYKQ